MSGNRLLPPSQSLLSFKPGAQQPGQISSAQRSRDVDKPDRPDKVASNGIYEAYYKDRYEGPHRLRPDGDEDIWEGLRNFRELIIPKSGQDADDFDEKIREAEAQLEKLLAQSDRTNYDLLIEAGHFYIDHFHKPDRAYEHFGEAVKVAKENNDFLAQIEAETKLYLAYDQQQAAERRKERRETADKYLKDANAALAKEPGDFESVRGLLERALSVGTDDYKVYKELGDIYKKYAPKMNSPAEEVALLKNALSAYTKSHTLASRDRSLGPPAFRKALTPIGLGQLDRSPQSVVEQLRAEINALSKNA